LVTRIRIGRAGVVPPVVPPVVPFVVLPLVPLVPLEADVVVGAVEVVVVLEHAPKLSAAARTSPTGIARFRMLL
jgi:hypothetical protein